MTKLIQFIFLMISLGVINGTTNLAQINSLYSMLGCSSEDVGESGSNLERTLNPFQRFYDCLQVQEIADDVKPIIRDTYDFLNINKRDELTFQEVTSQLKQHRIPSGSANENKFNLCDLDNNNALDLDEYTRGAVFSYGLDMLRANNNRDLRLTKNELSALIKEFSISVYHLIRPDRQLRVINSISSSDGYYYIEQLAEVDTILFQCFVNKDYSCEQD